MIFSFFIIAILQCSVNFLLYSMVTQLHIQVYILFSHMIMLHHKWRLFFFKFVEFTVWMACGSIMQVAAKYNPKAKPQVTKEKGAVKYVS